MVLKGTSCSAPILAFQEAQARSPATVFDKGVEAELAGVVRPQARLDEHHHQRSGGVVGQAVEVVGGLDLAHDVLGDVAGQGVRSARQVVDVDGHVIAQVREPAMAPAGFEEGS
jgi:hypothetical protein